MSPARELADRLELVVHAAAVDEDDAALRRALLEVLRRLDDRRPPSRKPRWGWPWTRRS